MGKPLSAEHKAKISAALKARNAAKGKSGGSKAPSKPSGLNGRDSRSMSGADKAKAAETMYGTGSKQHKAAVAKFGDKPAPKRGPVKSDKTDVEIRKGRADVNEAVAKHNASLKSPRMTGPLTKRQGPNPQEQQEIRRQQRETQAQMDKVKAARAARGEPSRTESKKYDYGNAELRRIGKRAARQADAPTMDWARAERAANTRRRRPRKSAR